MRKLYKFERYFRRQGTLRGFFIEDEKLVEKVIGERIYFGEVLGKHSEIIIDLDDEDISIVTDDQDFIDKFEKLIGCSGHNPISRWQDMEDEEDIEE